LNLNKLLPLYNILLSFIKLLHELIKNATGIIIDHFLI